MILNALTLQCMCKVDGFPTLCSLEAWLLPFTETLEKGQLGLVVEAVLFSKVSDSIRCSILQNVKMCWTWLLLFLESGGGTSPREHQGRTLGVLSTPQSYLPVG